MFFNFNYNGSINKIIKIKGNRFYFTKINNRYCLISLRCPHQGGNVKKSNINNCLKCPVHGWSFNFKGESITGSKGLDKIFVEYVDNKIIVNNLEFVNIIRLNDEKKIKNKKNENIKIKLLSHACLLFKYKKFNLITDPWLKGLAFNESWIQYPSPYINSLKFKPSTILITHEHSDHLSIETLKNYSKNTPIYFPAFPNKRIEKILKKNKFSNLNPMYFGKKYNLFNKIYITCYQPISNFNDSIHLLEFSKYKILNLNDSGINYKIARNIGAVDIICSTFGSGASGYPMCWTDITQQKKEKILNNQFLSRINLLDQAAKIYKAKYILPFASYFALINKEHQKYNDLIFKYKIHPEKIKNKIKTKFKIIDLLPGDEFDCNKNQIKYYFKNRKNIFKLDNVNKFLEYKRKYFTKSNNIHYHLNKNKIENYFLSFNSVPEIKFVKNYTFFIEIFHFKNLISLMCKIVKGKLTILKNKKQKYDLHIKIPSFLLNNIVKYNMSWDEAYIGYWCEFKNERKFNLDFWRLIHAPYFKNVYNKINKRNNILNFPISYFINKNPDHSRRIFGFMGMHCLDCNRNTQESVFNGAIKHGLNDSECKMLSKMLKNYLS